MELTIRYNRSSVHIQGLTERTTGAVNNKAEVTGVVSYYAESACGGLTRSGYKMAVSNTYDNAEAALKGAQLKARALGLKMCKSCEKAAQRMIDETTTETCAARVMHDAIGFGCVKTGKHDDHATALGLKWRDGEDARDCSAPGCVECGNIDLSDFSERLYNAVFLRR